MSGRDPYRRVRSARAVGRVAGGQDEFDKEAVEGNPASDFYTLRRELVSGLPVAAPTEKESSFAQRLQRKAVEAEADKSRKR